MVARKEKKKPISLTLIKLSFLRVVFSGGSNWLPHLTPAPPHPPPPHTHTHTHTHNEMLKDPKNRWKLIGGESLHVFWTNWGISMKFSRKMWLTMISKVTKKKGFTITLDNKFLEKPQGGSNLPLPTQLF